MTLVELLVVITIIVVLAALSIVSIARLRSTARGATCISNLRQIGATMLMYSADKNGQLPPLEDRTAPGDALKGIWPQIIADAGYLERVTNSRGRLSCNAGVWACPECTVVQTNYQGYGGAEGTVLIVKKSSLPESGSAYVSKIPRPERTWLVGDAVATPKDLKSGWYAIWGNPSSWGGKSPGARHGGKVNVCMVDGHVESLTLKELNASDYTMFKKP
jgi:prepilin-type processing-associated H-X9-DG protein